MTKVGNFGNNIITEHRLAATHNLQPINRLHQTVMLSG